MGYKQGAWIQDGQSPVAYVDMLYTMASGIGHDSEDIASDGKWESSKGVRYIVHDGEVYTMARILRVTASGNQARGGRYMVHDSEDIASDEKWEWGGPSMGSGPRLPRKHI